MSSKTTPLPSKNNKAYWNFIKLSHSLIYGPLLIYIGFNKPKKKNIVYYILAFLTISVILIHSYMYFFDWSYSGESRNDKAKLLNLIHVIVFGLLFGYISYQGLFKNGVEWPMDSMSIILGVGVIFHHLKKYLDKK